MQSSTTKSRTVRNIPLAGNRDESLAIHDAFKDLSYDECSRYLKARVTNQINEKVLLGSADDLVLDIDNIVSDTLSPFKRPI